MRKDEIMNGIDCDKSKVIANNTVEYWQGDTRIIRHFHTDILKFEKNSITFNINGHLSLTTRKRLNEYQDQIDIWQEARVWYCLPNNVSYWSISKEERKELTVVFKDGMTFYHNLDDVPDEIKVHCKKFGNGYIHDFGNVPDKKLIKKIKKYVNDYMAALPINAPDGGDCWICLSETNRDHWTDNNHLMSHIERSYYVPTLLMNAVLSSHLNNQYLESHLLRGAYGLVTLTDYDRSRLKSILYQFLYNRIINNEMTTRYMSTGYSV